MRNTNQWRTSGPIPVCWWVIKTFAYCDRRAITKSSYSLEHVFGQVVDGLIMSVVAQGEHVVCCRVRCSLVDVIVEVILRVLDQIRSIIQVVKGVEVVVHNVVTNGCQAGKAVVVAINVRRPEVCWKIA